MAARRVTGAGESDLDDDSTKDRSAPGRVLLVQPHTPSPYKWLSMTKYAAGIALALAPVSSVRTIGATHLNTPPPVRALFPRYRNVRRLPRRWDDPLDLVHFTDVFVAPHADRFPCPRVATLHDMIPLEYARFRRVLPLRWRTAFLRSLRGLGGCGAIVVPSQATKREYLAYAADDPAKVFVIPVVVPPEVTPPPPGEVREQRTILSVGTNANYKNVAVLLHALARPELAGSRVIRVGAPFDPPYQRLAESLGVSDRIEHRTGISEAALLRLYQTATVLVQPSLTEGFGMPVAEAMAAGLPVVTSDGGALPEVAEGAGRIVPFRTHRAGNPDMDDARDFGMAIAEVLADSAGREEMSRTGIERAGRFRPDAVRPLLLAAYEHAARQYPPR